MMSTLSRFFEKLAPPNIYDAVYSFATEEMNTLNLPSAVLQKKGMSIRLASFFFWFLKDLGQSRGGPAKLVNAELKNKVVFFYSSINEKRALEDLGRCVPNGITIAGQIAEPNKISFLIPNLLGLMYAPWVFFQYLMASGHRKKSFSFALDQYLFACGYIVYLRFMLARNRPALVVVSNDHSMLSRTFALACRELQVPVAYVQHASVSEKFPKLMFDYAFLDGVDALEKYQKKGLGDCVVFLAGISKLDQTLRQLSNLTLVRNCISICPNDLDEVDPVMAAAKYILEKVGNAFTVCVRPHPGDTRRFNEWRQKSLQIGGTYSAPEVERSTDLIIKSAIVIAADSNILLEAALLKATPICMPFKGKILDHYGFIRRGVVFYADNPVDLINGLDGAMLRTDFYTASKYFSHSVGTGSEGRSAELIGAALTALAEKKPVSSAWRPYAKNVFEVT